MDFTAYSWSLGETTKCEHQEQNRSGNVKSPIQVSGNVLNGAAQPRHEETETPANEYQAIVKTEVLGPEKVCSEGWQQCQTTAILPVGDADYQKQEPNISAFHHRRQGEQTQGRDKTVEDIRITPANFI